MSPHTTWRGGVCGDRGTPLPQSEGDGVPAMRDSHNVKESVWLLHITSNDKYFKSTLLYYLIYKLVINYYFNKLK